MRQNHFAPYVPGSDGPWDTRTAGHLLRRAGFGAARAEIDQAVEQGIEATVERLLDVDDDQEGAFAEVFGRIDGSLVDFADAGQLQAWWAYRMATTRTPLCEKMTLFWHGHFATSYYKVEDTYLMHRQCETLRRLACGNFRDLVLAVAKDPAMLVYLDGETNTKAHPNENFARELMELFTCGIGNYTEQDVLEAARAFTGWHRNGAEFLFNPEEHDDGRKQVLGKSGRFDGADVVDILMQHPATQRFIARKLLRFFATPEPSDEVLTEAAAVLDRTQLNIKWFLRELFLSKYFYSDQCYRKRIASPAEFVIGTVRTLGVRMTAGEMAQNMAAMGQELFAPPNVKGWDGEQKWINSTAWAARTAFARRVAELVAYSQFGPNLDMSKIVPDDVGEPAKVVSLLADQLLDGSLSNEARRDLEGFLVTTDEGPKPDLFRDDAGFRQERVRAALGTLLSLPEYHAC